MLVNKTADLHFLGSLIDLTTLRHELSFVFVLHEDIFSETQLIPNDECNRRRVYGYPVRDFDDMDTKIYRSIWDKIHIPSAAMWHMFRKTKLYESLINIPDPQPENDGNHKAPRIFISYKRVDKIKVFSIKNIIESKTGLKCWIDLDDIQSDAQFINVIAEAINNAEIVLFMYSKTHNAISDYETDWTWREINFAEHKKKRIVFVNIDQSPLSDAFSLLFGSKQQVDALSDDAMNRLFADLKQWLPEN